MIVCSCNAIRDRDIKDAARRGCPCPDSAYRSLGCEFQCGSCRDHAEDLIVAARADLLSVDAQAA
jgi:bacterioferritin-associated ferredoxin